MLSEIVELMILEKFCSILPLGPWKSVYQKQMSTLDEIIHMVENLMEADLDCMDSTLGDTSQDLKYWKLQVREELWNKPWSYLVHSSF